MPNSPLGRPFADIQAEVQARADLQPAVSRCAFCPDYHFEGTASECRAASASHQARYHPQYQASKVRRGSIRRHHNPDHDWREAGLKNGAEIAKMLAARERAA